MKRTPLVRRTPLASVTPLKRGSGLTSSSPLVRAAKLRPRARARPGRPAASPIIPAPIRADVLARDHGICLFCGRHVNPDAWECHHRRLRSHGRDDSLSNLITLHPGCHEWVHANPLAAAKRGLMVRAGSTPLEVPVRVARLGEPSSWALLTDDGRRLAA